MNREDQVKELFYYSLEQLEKLFHMKATVTVNGIWVTIQFGDLVIVMGRGYVNALRLLEDELEDLTTV